MMGKTAKILVINPRPIDMFEPRTLKLKEYISPSITPIENNRLLLEELGEIRVNIITGIITNINPKKAETVIFIIVKLRLGLEYR